ncbi:MAG: hypothetical protein DRG73_10860 [Deltaproteobacteria bacterium]|nr:MAG: hypothetical protein DRG73_10860 [Deltaproteobacteria bacterium]
MKFLISRQLSRALGGGIDWSQTSNPIPAILAFLPLTPSAKTIPGQRRILIASVRKSFAMEEKSLLD